MRGRGGAQAGGVKAAASRVMDVGLETLENLGPVPGLLVRLPAAAGPRAPRICPHAGARRRACGVESGVVKHARELGYTRAQRGK